VLVSLDEPMVVAESARLAAALKDKGTAVVAEVWNRVEDRRAPANQRAEGVTGASLVLLAPLAASPLVGTSAIREWSQHWLPRSASLSH
jgi:hypothetical protein